MIAQGRSISVLVVTGLLSAEISGCSEQYTVRTEYLAAAHALSQQTVPPERIAVLAAAPHGEQLYLRYSKLTPGSAPSAGGTSKVLASESAGQRRTGTVLFVLGLLHLAGLAAHIGYEVVSARNCLATPGCIDEDFSPLITGPVLGVPGFALLVTGIGLMAKGYGSPSDVSSGRTDFSYLGSVVDR